MRTVAVFNQKGGVGKTTTAVNLGAALARAGRRVCLVDLDPQAHATLHLSSTVQPSQRPGCHLYHVLVEGVSLEEVCQRAGDHLELAPGGIELAAVEVELSNQEDRESVLRRQLESCSKRWDFLIVDCPPSLGLLTLNALCAVQEVLLPMQPHFLALHGLSQLLNTLQWVAQRRNPRLRLSGIVLCLFESTTRLSQEVLRDVENFLTQWRGQECVWSEAILYRTRVRRNVRLAEAPSFGKSIFDYAPNSPGAADYEALAQEVLQQTELSSCKPIPVLHTLESFPTLSTQQG